jgi:hypothetical protein
MSAKPDYDGGGESPVVRLGVPRLTQADDCPVAWGSRGGACQTRCSCGTLDRGDEDVAEVIALMRLKFDRMVA